jgi:hypothetical protein
MSRERRSDSRSDETRREAGEDETERKIDRDLEDSFPASDPPGWTLGVERPNREGHDESVDGVG